MGFIHWCLAMRSFWSDPYLWVHLAGLAVVPILLEVCLLGFAVGDPTLPVWFELCLVGGIGIAPVLWMQWQRPFYIFSLVAVAIKPEQLTEDQRRLLTLFKSQRNRILAVGVPVLLFFLLYQVYKLAPIAAPVALFPSGWRVLGLLVAAIAFLAINLFTQVPFSVLGVMLHRDPEFAATPPYPLEQIRRNFSLVGLQVKQILPSMIAEPPTEPAVAPSVGIAEQAATGNPELDSESETESEPAAEPTHPVSRSDEPEPHEPEVSDSTLEPFSSEQDSSTLESEPSSNGDSASTETTTEEDVWGL
jgi:hypothetical protein